MKKLLSLKPSMHHFQIMKKNKVGEIMKSFDCENMVNFRVEFNKGNMAYEMSIGNTTIKGISEGKLNLFHRRILKKLLSLKTIDDYGMKFRKVISKIFA